MFKHVQTYTKARDFTQEWCFFLMLNQNSGAVDVYGIMQSAITVLSFHMLLYVALYIILFLHICICYLILFFFKCIYIYDFTYRPTCDYV